MVLASAAPHGLFFSGRVGSDWTAPARIFFFLLPSEPGRPIHTEKHRDEILPGAWGGPAALAWLGLAGLGLAWLGLIK